jgi:hypothetical protein
MIATLSACSGGGAYSASADSGGIEGLLAAADGYAAMWGTYDVDEDQQTFTITPEGALQRAMIGAATVRHVNFLDGLAVFNTTPQVIDGIETTTYITWRPVSPS